MDVWIIAFIALSVVLFLVSFTIPRLAMRKSKPAKKKAPTPLPKAAPERHPIVEEAEWTDYASQQPITEPAPAYRSPAEKGFRIAYKQYRYELDTFLREVSSTTSIVPYHRKKYNELYTFYSTSVKPNEGSLSDSELKEIRESLSRAKQIITRFST